MVCLSPKVNCQTSNEVGPATPIQLIFADSLVGNSLEQGSVREFIGRVKFIQGNVTVTCNRAVQDIGSNTVDLYGNVVIKQDDLLLKAPHVKYSGESSIAVADGNVEIRDAKMKASGQTLRYNVKTRLAELANNVVIIDDSATIYSDSSRYDRLTRNSIAWGSAVVRASDGTMIMKADSVSNYPTEHTSIARGNATVWNIDTTNDDGRLDTSSIKAHYVMKRDTEMAWYMAVGNVEIVDGTSAAVCDSAEYHVTADSIVLSGEPVVWTDATRMKANQIVSVAIDDQSRIIRGFGQAFVLTVTDSLLPERVDQISADTILIHFRSKKPYSLLAYTNAQSINFSSENETGDGLVQFSSDTISANFEENALKDVFWLGGIHGEHHPEKLVFGRERQFRLQGYPDLPLKPTKPPVVINHDVLILKKP